MKKLFAVLFAGVLLLGLSAGSAQAAPINITISAAGNLLNAPGGVASDDQYDALIAGNGNSAADNLAFLSALITRWNAVPKTPVLPAAGALAYSQDSLRDASSYAGSAGYQYVVFHWGAGQAGENGWWAAYYLGGSAISFSAVPKVGEWDDDEYELESVGGFSSARYFGATSVPDGGMTLILLGGALVGIGALRRKFRA